MMKYRPFFTVVIPNYKTEPFLEQCLESLVVQDFQDFEVILLNDGSPGVLIPNNKFEKTNSSGDYWYREDFNNRYIPKLENLSKQCEYIFRKTVGSDQKFSFINKKNTGQGPTRNIGIKQSKGSRLVLLDCDDFLPKDYLQKAYNKIQPSPDKIYFGQLKVYQDSKFIDFKYTQKYVTETNNLESILIFPTWTINPINYFWEIDILKKYKIGFPDPKRNGEDTSFIIDAILAMYKEKGHYILKDFEKIDIFYSYRSFPYQNYKVKDFEINLFTDTVEYMKSKSDEIGNISLKYNLLAKLFIIRFELYKRKLRNRSVLKFTYGILAKFFTLLAFIVKFFVK